MHNNLCQIKTKTKTCGNKEFKEKYCQLLHTYNYITIYIHIYIYIYTSPFEQYNWKIHHTYIENTRSEPR